MLLLIQRDKKVYEYRKELNNRGYEICSAYLNTLFNDKELLQKRKEYYENFKKHWNELNNRGDEICSAYLSALLNDKELSQKCKEYHENCEKHWNEILEIPYAKMLFMFWIPLKDKYWLTEEQMNFLNRTNIEQQ